MNPVIKLPLRQTQRRHLIPPNEEADLSWYFGPGAAYFERSTFGEQMRRADEMSHSAEPCPTCSGLGFVELTAEQIVDRSRRLEAEMDPTLRANERVALCEESQCPDCRGSALDQPKRITHNVKGRVTWDFNQGCTALPAPPKNEEQGSEPDDWALCRYARVCRRLLRVPLASVEVLRLYYGDNGTRWATQSVREGRMLALYALTPSGAKLAKRGLSADNAATLGALGVRLDEAIASQCEAQRMQPEGNRGRMLERAREDAKRLLEAAAELWEGSR